MTVKVEGKGGISVEIIADSYNPNRQRITTFRLVYHRYFHSEFLTHRVFSRNASSSRAVPVKTAAQYVLDNPAMPIFWGKNQAGMQAKEELDDITKQKVQRGWEELSRYVAHKVNWLSDQGLHKQHAARPLESFQFMHVIMTATDLNNFDWLRDDEMAQPEIEELAKLMKRALDNSKPVELQQGEWHLPFVESKRDPEGTMVYFDDEGNPISLVDALKISASVCAQVSYRKGDASLEKANDIWDRLAGAEKVHASPFEHQATPIVEREYKPNGNTKNDPFDLDTWEDGITHVTRDGMLCSGNFKGWIQHRQLIPNHVKN